MDYIDHKGNRHKEDGTQDRVLSVLYHTRAGRSVLKVLVQPWISELAGKFLDTRASRCLIAPFVKSNHLDLEPYEIQDPKEYASYNDFFTRRIRQEMRVIDEDPRHLPSPCDSKITVYPIDEMQSFTIKNAVYTLEGLLRNKSLARRYQGGYAVILRLCVTDYHRYIYPVTGRKSENIRIPGIFHTVNPIAVEQAGVFHENTREYTLIKNEVFGTVLQMEVGALLVGRICNEHGPGEAVRGMEKGRFEFGGSTIVLLLEKGKVQIREDLITNTQNGCETEVEMGEMIGKAK